jgi:hypothetical protein
MNCPTINPENRVRQSHRSTALPHPLRRERNTLPAAPCHPDETNPHFVVLSGPYEQAGDLFCNVPSGPMMMTMKQLLRFTALPLLAMMTPATEAAQTQAPTLHKVSFDGYSFLVDGARVYLWSGEFHPYRLPSPDLWRDIFQKMKAAGFNTTSIYFSWGYHSPREGEYDLPASATWTACWTRRRRRASMSSPVPAPTSMPRSTAAASPVADHQAGQEPQPRSGLSQTRR